MTSSDALIVDDQSLGHEPTAGADALGVRLPDPGEAVVVVPAPGEGPGHWAGAASALRDGDDIWLAYRVRRPLAEGRGVSVVVARSRDGVAVEPVCEVTRDQFGAESLEKPCLVRCAAGWRLYLSCATPGSRHWWVDSLTADTVADLPRGRRQVTNAGLDVRAPGGVGVKDPVVRCRPLGDDNSAGEAWDMWLCCHPLDEADSEDRMTTRHLTSDDGLAWSDHGVVLAPRAGEWDARGARVTAVVPGEPLALTYDGRPDAASNWFETTGLVVERDGALERVDGARVRSSWSDGAFRYCTVVTLPDGRLRWYAEMARADGAHDLVTMTTPGR